jgi:Phage tail tube protein, GTA-gp10
MTDHGETGTPNRVSPTANAVRGEASLRVGGAELVLRPTFSALVAAEAELGPLFALVERAAGASLGLGEMVCARGLSGATPVLRVLLGQILRGA